MLILDKRLKSSAWRLLRSCSGTANHFIDGSFLDGGRPSSRISSDQHAQTGLDRGMPHRSRRTQQHLPWGHSMTHAGVGPTAATAWEDRANGSPPPSSAHSNNAYQEEVNLTR